MPPLPPLLLAAAAATAAAAALSLRSNELRLTSVRVALAMVRIFFNPSTSFESSLISSLRDLSSSQLKLLSSKAKKRLSTRKLPMTRAGRKMEKQISDP